MDQILVREGNGEVIIYMDRHLSDALEVLETARRLLECEILRAKAGKGQFVRLPYKEYK